LQDAVAGSADGRVFVAAVADDRAGKTVLLRFSLTSTGRVTGLSEVPQSVMPVLDQVSLAVSADGTWAAIAGLPQTDRRWRHDVGADPLQRERQAREAIRGVARHGRNSVTDPGGRLRRASGVDQGRQQQPVPSARARPQWCESVGYLVVRAGPAGPPGMRVYEPLTKNNGFLP